MDDRRIGNRLCRGFCLGHGQRAVFALPPGLDPPDRSLRRRPADHGQPAPGGLVCRRFFDGAVHHHRRGGRRLCAAGPYARGRGHLVAGAGGHGADLGALGMLGVQACSMSGALLCRLNLRGIHGAFGLGLAYGILSGSCTFGFIAPILAIVTVQQKIVVGSVMMILFAIGHCLPIAVAGSSTALVRRLTESSTWQGAGQWFRRGAGVVIALLGVYFIS